METLTPKTQRFPKDPADSISYDRSAGFAAAGARLRDDLLADLAMARAALVLKPDKAEVSAEEMATRERASRHRLDLEPDFRRRA